MFEFYKNALDHARSTRHCDKIIACAHGCRDISHSQLTKLRAQADRKPAMAARRLRELNNKLYNIREG